MKDGKIRGMIIFASLLLVLLLSACTTHSNVVNIDPNKAMADGKIIMITKLEAIVYEKPIPKPTEPAEVSLTFKNTSGKTIKQIEFELMALDKTGNPVECQVTGSSIATIQAFGPYRHGADNLHRGGGLFAGAVARWPNVWWNNKVSDARLLAVTVEFMDGSIAQIEGDEVEELFVKPHWLYGVEKYSIYKN